MSVSNKKFICLGYQKGEEAKEKYVIIHDSINFRRVDGRIYSMVSEDETVFVFEFETREQGEEFAHYIRQLEYNLKIARKLKLSDDMFYKHGWFLCAAHNRKEARDDRGSLYRSITVFSSKLNYFERFADVVDEGCLQYSELPPFNMWKEPHKLTGEGIVKSVFYQVRSMVQDAPLDGFRITDDLVLDLAEDAFEEDTPGCHFKPAPMKGSISTLIKLFRENTLHIFRALLQEKRVIVFGEKTTTA